MPVAEAAKLFAAYADTCVLALAVSGGSDSMALLHLALEAFPPERLRVLTVDHGLREGSRAEAEKVRVWCATLGIGHNILTWTGPKPGSGIQARARAARYDLMTAWCTTNGVPVLLTAHTMHDQAETVAMRMARTDSARSLAGIWPQTEWNGVRIARPLLGLRREVLRNYLRERQAQWIDDPSNANPMFERVRVRRAMREDKVEELAQVARHSQEHVSRLDKAVATFMSRHVSIDRFSLIHIKLSQNPYPSAGRDPASKTHAPNQCQIPDCAGMTDVGGGTSDRTDVADIAVISEILSRAVALTGQGERPQPATVTRLLEERKRATLGGAIVVFRKGEILVGREPGRIPSEPVLISESGKVNWDGRFIVQGPVGAVISAAGPVCPKPDKDVPAVVIASLPAVRIGSEKALLPHFQADPRIGVDLSERFRF